MASFLNQSFMPMAIPTKGVATKTTNENEIHLNGRKTVEVWVANFCNIFSFDLINFKERRSEGNRSQPY